jgi:hypothetical protein
MSGSKLDVVDFESAGKDGRVLDIGGARKVLWAGVQRRSGVAEGTVGEVSVGYHGLDTNVDKPSEFAVYNAGDAGQPMRALVICG